MEYVNLTQSHACGLPPAGILSFNNYRLYISFTERNGDVEEWKTCLIVDESSNHTFILNDADYLMAKELYKKALFISESNYLKQVEEIERLQAIANILSDTLDKEDKLAALLRLRKNDLSFLRKDFMEAIGDLCLDFINKYGPMLSRNQQQIAGSLFKNMASQEMVVTILFDMKKRDLFFKELYDKTLRKNDG